MAGGLGNHRTGWVDARAVHQPLINGALESEGWPTGIAHRGEALHQGLLGGTRGG